MISDRSRRLVLCAVIFCDMLAFSLVIPSLPGVVQDFGGAGLALGLVFSGYSLAQFIAAPLLGRLSDRIGRRQLLLLALTGSVLSLGLSALATSLAVLLAARVLAGFCGGSISVAMAMLADSSDAKSRTRIMGMGGASVGLAFTIGPALGALFAGWGFAALCLVGAAIAAATLAAAFFLLPTQSSATTKAGGASQPMGGSFLRLLAITGLSMLMFVGMEATLGLFVEERFAWSADRLGWLLALAGLSYVLVQMSLVWRLADKFGEWPVSAGAALLMAGALVLVPFAGPATLIAGIVLIGASQGFLTTLTTSLASRMASAGSVGQHIGANQAVSALGRVLGPALAGLLYDAGPLLAYGAMGLFGLAAAALALRNGAEGEGRLALRNR